METAYEAIYIVDTGLPDDQMNAIVDKYTGVVTRGGGTVDDIDRWEPRRLAYEVKGKREGVHICMNFRSEPAAKDELDRIFRISDDVLRHMVIKADEKADRFPSKARAAENERREREMAARMAAAPPPPATPAEEATVTELSATPPVDDTARREEAAAADGEQADAPEPGDQTPAAAPDPAETAETPAGP